MRDVKWLPNTLLLCLCLGAAAASACSAGSSSEKATGNTNNGTDGPTYNPSGGPKVDLIVDPTNPVGPTGKVEVPKRSCEAACENLPSAPLIVEGTPSSAPGQFPPFDEAQIGRGPCISDPPNGALFPYNWTRPRIKWNGQPGQVYEVRIRSARQKSVFVAYTNKMEFYVPRAIWEGDAQKKTPGLAVNSWGDDILLEVRDVTGAASQVKIQTAPVAADGSLVYWVTDKDNMTKNNGWLKGFKVGDEASADTLTVAQRKMPSYEQGGNGPHPAGGNTSCIGCHTSTPDGNAVVYNDGWPWNGMISSITPGQVGNVPDYVTPGGQVVLNMPWQGVMTFSSGNWATGKRWAITTTSQTGAITWNSQNPGNNNATTSTQLMWLDLAASRPTPEEAAYLGKQTWQLQQQVFPALPGIAFGVMARKGDSRAAVTPDWSHDGSTIVYTSSTTARDGHVGTINDTDVFRVPFGNGSGGDAAPVAAAAQKGVAEYYPDFSADDQLIAFNRIENAGSVKGELYSRAEAEIWIAPFKEGGVTAGEGEKSAAGAIRLRANDADQCSVEKSPGLGNSWAKWSPAALRVEETQTTYYWLIFSSARGMHDRRFAVDNNYPDKDTRYVQLYMAPITVTNGKVRTYPALYLWNQNSDKAPFTSNFTPAWDAFNIPEIPDPPEIY